jgi:hypothetical protein
VDHEPAHSHPPPGCVLSFPGHYRSSDINPEVATEINKPDSLVIPRNPQSSKDIAKAQFNSKSSTFEAGRSRRFSDTKTNADLELAVQVHVEQSISVDYQSRDHGGDRHQTPDFAWESRS